MKRASRSEFASTVIELKAMAAAAKIGMERKIFNLN